RTRHGNASVDRRHTGSHPERICSDVREDARAEPDDPAIATSGEFHVLDVIAPMRCREKTLPPAFAPRTRAAVANRQKCAEDVLSVESQLGAKSTTDVRGDEPEFVQRKTQAVCQRTRMRVRQLTGRVMRQVVRSAVEVRQDSSTLERCGSDAVVGETPLNDAIGFRKRAIDVSTG